MWNDEEIPWQCSHFTDIISAAPTSLYVSIHIDIQTDGIEYHWTDLIDQFYVHIIQFTIS